MCDFEENEEIMNLPCGHIYHTECIEMNFKERSSCPLCHMEFENY